MLDILSSKEIVACSALLVVLFQSEVVITMKNIPERTRLKENRVRYWELAEALGINPSTLTVWLRHELPDDKRQRVNACIDSIIARRAET